MALDVTPETETYPILDTHHHFWQISRGDYSWMTPELLIARDYLPDDLVPELRRNGVSRTIVVQAADTEAETDFLLNIAEENSFVAGVCGWLDLDTDSFPDRLAHYMENPLWKSFRPMLQDLEEPDWILKPRVMKNLAHTADVGARFEVLTRLPQLPFAIEALKQLPELMAVVNHLSKPDIAGGKWQPWASQIEELAHLPNVYCKLSGMVTEANASTWTPSDLSPYIKHVSEMFGAERIMFGSDWPVALLAASGYGETVNVLRTSVASMLSSNDQRKLFHDNGARFYGLPASRVD